MLGKNWSRGDVIALGGLVVAVLSLGVAITIPEIRLALLLDSPSDNTREEPDSQQDNPSRSNDSSQRVADDKSVSQNSSSTISDSSTSLIQEESIQPQDRFSSTEEATGSSAIPSQEQSLSSSQKTCKFMEGTQDEFEIPVLQITNSSATSTGVIVSKDAGSTVNIRAGAGENFQIIAIAQPSEAVTLVGHALSTKCEAWYRIEFSDNRIGWIHKNFVASDRGFGLYD